MLTGHRFKVPKPKEVLSFLYSSTVKPVFHLISVDLVKMLTTNVNNKLTHFLFIILVSVRENYERFHMIAIDLKKRMFIYSENCII